MISDTVSIDIGIVTIGIHVHAEPVRLYGTLASARLCAHAPGVTLPAFVRESDRGVH